MEIVNSIILVSRIMSAADILFAFAYQFGCSSPKSSNRWQCGHRCYQLEGTSSELVPWKEGLGATSLVLQSYR
jgi:hypothetical protein